jgi:hypothetical protein
METYYNHSPSKVVVGCEIATWTSMPSDLIVFHIVSALQNINLPVLEIDVNTKSTVKRRLT